MTQFSVIGHVLVNPLNKYPMKSFVLISLGLLIFLGSSLAQSFSLENGTSLQEAYAAAALKKALGKKGCGINAGKPDYAISLKLKGAVALQTYRVKGEKKINNAPLSISAKH